MKQNFAKMMDMQNYLKQKRKKGNFKTDFQGVLCETCYQVQRWGCQMPCHLN